MLLGHRMSFNDFSVIFLSSGGHFVQRSGTICAILVEGIMGNIQVFLKKIRFGPVVQGRKGLRTTHGVRRIPAEDRS